MIGILPCHAQPQNVHDVQIMQQAQCHAAAALPSAKARALIRRIALAQKFDVDFALAVARVESDDVSTQISPKGAYGLMQLMPDTAQKWHVDSCRPDQNVLGGILELRELERNYHNPLYVLAAYNAGNGALTKYHGLPPFGETISYVAKVLNHYYGWKQRFGSQRRVSQIAANVTIATAPVSGQAGNLNRPVPNINAVRSLEVVGAQSPHQDGVWKSGFVESFN